MVSLCHAVAPTLPQLDNFNTLAPSNPAYHAITTIIQVLGSMACSDPIDDVQTDRDIGGGTLTSLD